MRVVIDTDLAAFLADVRPWLSTDPVRHNVLMTVLQSRADGVEPIEDGIFLARILDGDELSGVAIRTPPHALLASMMSPAAAAALAAVVAGDDEVTAVNGSKDVAMPIAQAIADARGGEVRQSRGLGRFQLTQLIPPRPAPGAARVAAEADTDVIIQWTTAFHEYIGEPVTVNRDKATARIALGQMWLWEDGGEPVSMVNRSDPAGGVARVNLVYTPEALRGRGYASALVAVVTQQILDDGFVASLYTDLANPTSNKIYQALGYEKLDEAGIWAVTTPGEPSGT
jgi:uncharacterized protein